MLEMTHHSQKQGSMVVNVTNTYCDCYWDVEITAEDRMGPAPFRDEETGVILRAKKMPRPKHWYRIAENILLATGKVNVQKVFMRGKEVNMLVCKEHMA